MTNLEVICKKLDMDFCEVAGAISPKIGEIIESLNLEEPTTRGEYRGFLYDVTLSLDLFAYCGYVHIPEKLRGENLWDLDAHGGITYVAEDNSKIGFDCMHFRDLVPTLYLIKPLGSLVPEYAVFRDKDFVVENIKMIINQLIDRYEL